MDRRTTVEFRRHRRHHRHRRILRRAGQPRSTLTPTAPRTKPRPTTRTSSAAGVDIGLFFDGALAEDATIEDCTLSGGAETTCYSITVAGYPTSYEVGPFCPSTITDENGGLWWDGDALYDLNGEFIENLAEIYDDDNWQMYDEDGNVFVTETAEEFELAARPDVDPSLAEPLRRGPARMAGER